MELKKTRLAERILNCVSSKDTDKNWGVDVAASIGAIGDASAPASVDLRDDSWWRINNQGQTGSCVGWALADGVLRWHFVKSNQLSTSDQVSVRQVWVSAKETDEFRYRPTTFIEEAGTSLKAALTVAKNHGTVTEAELPFATNQRFGGTEEEFYGVASERRIKRYFDLQRNLNEWRKWIAQNGPLLARLDVDSNWNNLEGDRTGKLENYDFQSTKGGHAVALVGYTPDYFIVRNSWGNSWGDGGYAYASNDYAYRAFTEVYGVAV